MIKIRGDISDELMRQIDQRIPKIDMERFFLATTPDWGITLLDFCSDSNFHGTIECLSDAEKRFSFLQYTLFEAFACLAWYRNNLSESNEKEKTIIGKYYLDYANQLLYATGEDISWFIIFYLNIEESLGVYFKSEEGKKKLEKKRLISKMGKVGIYLKENFSGNPITEIVVRLKNDINWNKALKYRDEWVHNKPPGIIGMGNEFIRKNKITKDKNGKKVMYLGAHKQEYTIEQWLDITLHATEALASILSELLELVIQKRIEMKNHFIDPQKA